MKSLVLGELVHKGANMHFGILVQSFKEIYVKLYNQDVDETSYCAIVEELAAESTKLA
jgi:hypothetical protein